MMIDGSVSFTLAYCLFLSFFGVFFFGGGGGDCFCFDLFCLCGIFFSRFWGGGGGGGFCFVLFCEFFCFLLVVDLLWFVYRLSFFSPGVHFLSVCHVICLFRWYVVFQKYARANFRNPVSVLVSVDEASKLFCVLYWIVSIVKFRIK